MNTVRVLGPGVYGGFSAIRVVIAVALSFVWLGEPVRNYLEWVGIVIVCIVLTGFFRMFKKGEEEKEEEKDTTALLEGRKNNDSAL